LSEDETVGQFVTGDYFVVDSGGGVTVSSVTPAFAAGRNGSMKNPVAGGSHGLDSTALGYDAGKVLTFPTVLYAGDSLLSSIGRQEGDVSWTGATVHSAVVIKTVAVLTILDAQPPSNSFRPATTDRSHTIYTTSQINTALLPNLDTSSISLPNKSGWVNPLGYYERGTQRPWIVWGNDWLARTIHPIHNMLDFHEYIGQFLSETLLLLLTDVEGKTTLLNQVLQIAIDYYYADGFDSASWAATIVFGGLLLNDSSMYDYWIDNPSRRDSRGHEKLYYIGDRTTSSSTVVPPGETWVKWVSPEGKYVAFAKQVGEEHEHLHPSEWICYEPHCKNEVYRTQHDVYNLVGMTLALMIMDAHASEIAVIAKLNHPPQKDYVYRWMTENFMTDEYLSTGRTYYEEMMYYRPFTIYDINYGSGGSSFVDSMWNTYATYDPGDPPAPSCGPVNLELCLTSGDCTGAGGYWCDTVCQATPCDEPLPSGIRTSPVAADGTTPIAGGVRLNLFQP